MPNPFPTDEWIVNTLRDVEIPKPPDALMVQLVTPNPGRVTKAWILASLAATGTAVLAIALTMHPTPSLAQVAATQAAQTQFTMTNTRLFGKGRAYKTVTYRDGPLWRSGKTVVDSEELMTIQPIIGKVQVKVDAPSPLQSFDDFDVRQILKHGKHIAVIMGTDWNGKKVNKYENQFSFRAGSKIMAYNQEVIVDASTNLPLRMEILRDNGTWGNIWEFQYAKPNPNVFKLDIPKGAKFFDLRVERKELESKLNSGALLVSIFDSAILLPASSEYPRKPFPVEIEGSPSRLTARFETDTVNGKQITRRALINGKTWDIAFLNFTPGTRFVDLDNIQGNQLKVRLGTQGELILPVVHTCDTYSLLRPFTRP